MTTYRTAHRIDTLADTHNERWHQNGFNLCEVVVIRDGPAPDGTKYVDGRHQIHVATFAALEDAARAVRLHNEALCQPAPAEKAWWNLP